MNLAIPLRTAIVGASSIIAELTAYQDSYPVFTRRTVPTDAPYPMIVVSSDVLLGEEDGINDERPVPVRDIAVYGQNDTPANYRKVETIAYALRTLFHRKPGIIIVPGWSVTQILARGPMPAPTDDDQTVGRVVELTIRLYRKNP